MPASPIIPELHASDVEASARWLCDAFGFTVRLRMGAHRSQIDTGGGGAFVLTERTQTYHGTVSLMIRVANLYDHFAVAKRHGAQIVQTPEDYPYGERQYVCVDPDGNRWTFSQTIADVAPQTWGGVPG